MAQEAADPDTFTSLMLWLRQRGKSALALPLRRKGIGSLSALLSSSEQQLIEAGCPQDLIDLLFGAGTASPEAPGDLQRGKRVQLHGLVGAKELNGISGVVTGYEEAKGRWIIDLGGSLGKKLFKRANLVEQGDAPGPDAGAAKSVDSGKSSASTAPVPRSRAPAAPATAAKPATAAAPATVAKPATAAAPATFAKPATAAGQKSQEPPPAASMCPPAGRPAASLEAAAEGIAGDVPGGGGSSGEVSGDAARLTLQGEGDDLHGDAAAKLLPSPGPTANTGKPLRPGAQVLVETPSSDHPRYGQVGVCEVCNFVSGLWSVRFPDGEEDDISLCFLSERVPALRFGAHVKLVGLRDAAELNGQFGVLDEVDVETGRWSVCLESGEWKSLRKENLLPQDGSVQRSREVERSMRSGGDRQQTQFLTAMEEALASGELQWLDC